MATRDEYLQQLAYQRERLRDAALAAYGGPVCVCCGETEPAFLSLDHANDDGGKFRRELLGSKRPGTSHFYQWLKNNNYPQDLGLRVMCLNCNIGRSRNEGICPHKQWHYKHHRTHLREEDIAFIQSQRGRRGRPKRCEPKRIGIAELAKQFRISTGAVYRIQCGLPSRYDENYTKKRRKKAA